MLRPDPIIGVTGTFGSGKSTVIQILKEIGYSVIDGDKLVHQILKRPHIKERLALQFGAILRDKLAKIVFQDKKKRKELEELIHPLVIEEIEKKIDGLRKEKKNLIVVEAPLLFEAGVEEKFDKIMVVSCSERRILERLRKKGISEEEAKKRIKSQLSLKEKEKRADFVIDNSGTLQRTKSQILSICQKLT